MRFRVLTLGTTEQTRQSRATLGRAYAGSPLGYYFKPKPSVRSLPYVSEPDPGHGHR
jgi:hypothetical protein